MSPYAMSHTDSDKAAQTLESLPSLSHLTPQAKSIINASRLSIFFIDDFQVVRPNETGNSEDIRRLALELGIKEQNIFEYELKTQFRCSGSDAYLIWLDKVLGIRQSDQETFDARMEIKIIKIFDSPHELKRAIDEKTRIKPNSARIVAGFCWPWSEPRSDGTLVEDVVIGTFKLPWENKKVLAMGHGPEWYGSGRHCLHSSMV